MIEEIKSGILAALNRVHRPGMDRLIDYLAKSDFFTAPASTRFHASYAGGLATHSWNVYQVFAEKVKTYALDVPEESVIICSLLHDVCKIDFYFRGKRNVKEDGRWIEKEIWEVKDSFPFGHGEKSVYIIQKYIQLTDLEALTLRWHMGFSVPAEMWRDFDNAREKYPSVMALFLSDMESSGLREIKNGQ